MLEKWSRRGLTIGIPLSALTLILRVTLAFKPVTDRVNIAFGVRAYNALCFWTNIAIGVIISFVTICGVRCTVIILSQERAENREEEQRQRERLLKAYVDSGYSPETTRRVLNEVVLKDSKDMAPLVSECLSQLDAVDDIQRRQDLLFKSNVAEYIRKTLVTVDDSEKGICSNMHSIINSCNTAQSYATIDRNEVDKYLERNKRLIKCAERVLRASNAWVNSVNDGDRKDSEEELKQLTGVIQTILEEEKDEAEEE